MLRAKSLKSVIFTTIFSLLLVPAWAGDVEPPDIDVPDFKVAGDGKTPTFLQFLDAKGFEAKATKDLIAATPKGDAVYSFVMKLPPALFEPKLGFKYSSEGGMNSEMPYGWVLDGLVEIKRPLVRAYTSGEEENEVWDDEWLISGPGFSGTLKNLGDEDEPNRFMLKAADPIYVIANYNKEENSWTVYHDAVTYELEEMDDGAGTADGTALWRMVKATDTKGNYITCRYKNDLIDSISYGGNSETGAAHLITVAFAYADNTAVRTSARTGFVVEYEKHIDKITIQSGAGSAVVSSGKITDMTTNVTGSVAGKIEMDKLKPTSATVSVGSSKLTGSIASSVKTSGMTSLIGNTKSGSLAGAVSDTLSGVSGASDADDDEDSENRLYAYDLVYTVQGSLDLLTKLEREGATSLNAEVIASFEYSEFDETKSSLRTGKAPSTLGATEGGVEDDYGNYSDMTITAMLLDFNRDGLTDVMNSKNAVGKNGTDEYWDITMQKVDYSSRTLSWNTTYSYNMKNANLGYIQSTQKTVTRDEPARKSYTYRQVVDFNGDGYPDVIESKDPDEWVVSYGNGSHVTQAYVQNPPSGWEYSQETWALDAEKDGETSGIANWTKDIDRGMVDFNGDGWLDLFDPAAGKVWLHNGKMEGSFREKSLTLSYAFDAMRSVRYTIDAETFEIDTSAYCDKECEDSCEQEACSDVSDCESDCEDGSYACEVACEEDDEGMDDCIDVCENDSDREADAIADCQEGCSENCDEGEYMDECVPECVGECYGGGTRSKYISKTDETQGLYDMNGDGLPDFVDASSSTWKVYLNNGHDFEDPDNWSSPTKYIRRVDEGRPYVEWESDEMNISENNAGKNKPSRVYQMLIDVDGDGLLDLAMGVDLGNVWYPNTGGGFSDTARSLPSWWFDEFVASTSVCNVDGDSGESTSQGTTTEMMMDLDHDGMVDAVTTSAVIYGPYPRPYIITKVNNGQGGTTSVDYRSLSTVTPAGDVTKTQYTPNVKHLVDKVTSVDGLTSQNSEKSYSYGDGYYADGVFQGFKSRTEELELNGKYSSKMAQEFERSRDYVPLVTKQTLYTDGNLSFGSTLARGEASEKERFVVENSYGDYGNFHLIKTREITEYGESSGSKTTKLQFEWDNYGNMTRYKHDGGGDADDKIMITMSYVANDEEIEYANFFRMNRKRVYALVDSAYTEVSRELYFYDGEGDWEDVWPRDGLLTMVETVSGWMDGGEDLDASGVSIEYSRGSRGELLSVTDESGITVAQTFGFGAAVLETQTNEKGHRTIRTMDELGRITGITESNGMKLTYTYDVFDRVTKKEVTGTDGTTKTLNTMSYQRDEAPFYSTNKVYNESGSVEKTSYNVEDGFGNTMQDWKQTATGDHLVITKINDMRGLVVAASHPDKENTFSAPESVSVSTAFTRTYFDAMGSPRETIRDEKKGTGAQLVYKDEPWQEVRQDENGYLTRLTFDAHQRLVKVEQNNESGDKSLAAATVMPPSIWAQALVSGSPKIMALAGSSIMKSSVTNSVTKSTSTSSSSSSSTSSSSVKTSSKISPVEIKGSVTSGTSPGVKTKGTISSGAVSGLSSGVQNVMSDGYRTTARYEYDALDRLIKFSDGAGTSYVYSYDGAGRLRQVKYGATSASKDSYTAWHTYDYTGKLITRRTDATGAYAAWAYDDIGRVTTLTVSDSLPSAPATQTYSYEYDTKWVGSSTKETDQSGYTEFEFDGYGNVIKTKRIYDPSVAGSPTAEFSFDYDFKRLTSKTFPSGHKVDLTYAYGHLTKETASTAGATDYTLSYTYNDWGMVKSVTSTTGFKFTNEYTTPLWIDQLAVTVGGESYGRSYTWHNNGLLDTRSSAVDVSSSSLMGASIASSVGSLASTISSSLGSSSSSSSLSGSSSLSISGMAVGTATGTSATTSVVGSGALATGVTSILSSIEYTYTYDNLKQLAKIAVGHDIGLTNSTVESFDYDAAGNPQKIVDADGKTWTYPSAPTLNMISGRTSDAGDDDSYSYDAAGRLTEWKSATSTRNYYYDGLGRLRAVMVDGNWQMVLDYDAGTKLLRRADNNPFTGSVNYVYSFDNWRYDSKTAVVTEIDNDYVAAESGVRTWLLKDYDRHITMTFDDAGTVKSNRNLGAFGKTLSETGTPWDWNTFHGAEEQGELFHMGQRHLMNKDGQWLQPEPRLYTGLNMDALDDPLNVATYRYSRNLPSVMIDPSGNDGFTLGQTLLMAAHGYDASNTSDVYAFYTETTAGQLEVLAAEAVLVSTGIGALEVVGAEGLALVGVKGAHTIAQGTGLALEVVATGTHVVHAGEVIHEGVTGGHEAGGEATAGNSPTTSAAASAGTPATQPPPVSGAASDAGTKTDAAENVDEAKSWSQNAEGQVVDEYGEQITDSDTLKEYGLTPVKQ